LFPSAGDASRPTDPDNLRHRVWARLLTLAGIRAVRLHDLRHTFASLHLQAGRPVTWVSRQLGHHSPDFTWRIYSHFVPSADTRHYADGLANAVCAIPPVQENFKPEE